jgi:hypothetical protein
MISNTARTPWPSPSCSNRRRIRSVLLRPAVDAGSTTVCTTLQQLPAGQPPHARALCHSSLFAGGTPGRRDSSSEVTRCETNETFRDKIILARPRLSTRMLDSCATLASSIVTPPKYICAVGPRYWNHSSQLIVGVYIQPFIADS